MVDRGSFTNFSNDLSFVKPEVRSVAPVDSTVPLPEDFEPDNYSVICARGRDAFNHVGNRRFRVMVENHVSQYLKATSKVEKSVLSMKIVDTVRECSGIGGFIRQDPKTGRWYEVGDAVAREKVGQQFRNVIAAKDPTKYQRKKKKTVSSSSLEDSNSSLNSSKSDVVLSASASEAFQEEFNSSVGSTESAPAGGQFVSGVHSQNLSSVALELTSLPTEDPTPNIVSSSLKSFGGRSEELNMLDNEAISNPPSSLPLPIIQWQASPNQPIVPEGISTLDGKINTNKLLASMYKPRSAKKFEGSMMDIDMKKDSSSYQPKDMSVEDAFSNATAQRSRPTLHDNYLRLRKMGVSSSRELGRPWATATALKHPDMTRSISDEGPGGDLGKDQSLHSLASAASSAMDDRSSHHLRQPHPRGRVRSNSWESSTGRRGSLSSLMDHSNHEKAMFHDDQPVSRDMFNSDFSTAEEEYPI